MTPYQASSDIYKEAKYCSRSGFRFLGSFPGLIRRSKAKHKGVSNGTKFCPRMLCRSVVAAAVEDNYCSCSLLPYPAGRLMYHAHLTFIRHGSCSPFLFTLSKVKWPVIFLCVYLIIGYEDWYLPLVYLMNKEDHFAFSVPC